MFETKWTNQTARALRLTAGLPVFLLAISIGSANVSSQSLQNVTYVAGTPLSGHGMHGSLSVQSADTLTFQGSSPIAIPYGRVLSYETSSRNKVHVGLLPEALWKLVAPWPRAKQISLSYRDSNDITQVVVFEMSPADEALLIEVLKTRASRSSAVDYRSLRRPRAGMEPKL